MNLILIPNNESLPKNGELDNVCKCIDSGGVVVAPTDTLYALVCDALNQSALHRILNLKGRDDSKPFPVAVSSVEMATELAADITQGALWVMQRLWPGGLTVLLNPVPGLSKEIAGSGKVGVRQPDSLIIAEMIRRTGKPLCLTSANLSGDKQPVCIADIDPSILELSDYVLDGGPCRSGKPSTVVDLTGIVPVIVRQGDISREAIIEAYNEK